MSVRAQGNKQIMQKKIREDHNATEKEQWQILPEFPHYMINEKGDVRNTETGHLLKATSSSGQLSVIIRRDGETYHRGVRGLLKTVVF